jgi:hypothetical protein
MVIQILSIIVIIIVPLASWWHFNIVYNEYEKKIKKQTLNNLIDRIQKYGSTGKTWFRKGEVFNCMTIERAKELLWVMIKIRDYRGINTLKEFRIPIIVEARSLYGLSTWDYLNTWYRSDLVELYEKVCKQRKGHIYDIYPYYFEGV